MLGGTDYSEYPGLAMLLAVLGALMASVSGETITLVPDKPEVYGKVLFNVSFTERVFYYEWYKGNTTQSANQIIRYDPGKPVAKGLSYFEEAKIYPNGSLEITNLQIKFAGNYTIAIQASKLIQETVELTLTPPPPGDLHPGFIFLIVFGAIAVVATPISAVAYNVQKKKKNLAGPL